MCGEKFCAYKANKMKYFVPEIIFRIAGGTLIMQKNNRIVERTVISIVVFHVLFILSATGEPSSQQEQELLLLDALSKRQPSSGNSGNIGVGFASTSLSNYGSSNSIMDMLGRSNILRLLLSVRFV